MQSLLLIPLMTQILHTHKASRKGDVCADFAINLNESLHRDLLHFISSQGILQPISQEND